MLVINFHVLIDCVLAGVTSIAELKSKLVFCKFIEINKETTQSFHRLIKFFKSKL